MLFILVVSFRLSISNVPWKCLITENEPFFSLLLQGRHLNPAKYSIKLCSNFQPCDFYSWLLEPSHYTLRPHTPQNGLRYQPRYIPSIGEQRGLQPAVVIARSSVSRWVWNHTRRRRSPARRVPWSAPLSSLRKQHSRWSYPVIGAWHVFAPNMSC